MVEALQEVRRSPTLTGDGGLPNWSSGASGGGFDAWEAAWREAAQWPDDALQLSEDRPFQRSILVPLDGTEFAEHALPYAVAIARRAGVPIRLLHVYPQPLDEPLAFRLNAVNYWVRQQQRRYLGNVLRRVATAPSLEVLPVLHDVAGDTPRVIAQAIADYAHAGADLIVMATHRRGRWSRFWSSGVAERLASVTTLPLLLVRGRNASPDLTVEPPLERLLLPLDGRPGCERILDPALKLGRLTGAEYSLLSIVKSPSRAHRRSRCANLRSGDAHAQSYLRSLAARLGPMRQHVRVRTAFAKSSVANEIIWQAELGRFDLIALSRGGHTGLLDRLLPGVAEQVLQQTSMPILFARTTDAG